MEHRKGRKPIPEWMIPVDRRPAQYHPNREHERAWRDHIILRDMNTCRHCGRHSDYAGQMDVHHITYERFGEEEYEDGILLCRPCHEEVTRISRERRRDASRLRPINKVPQGDDRTSQDDTRQVHRREEKIAREASGNKEKARREIRNRRNDTYH
jgi:hypothetical protein